MWLLGFACIRWLGTWSVLAGGAVAAATMLVLRGKEVRALLQWNPRWVSIGVLAGAVMVAGTEGMFILLTRLIPELHRGTAGLYEVLRADAYPRPVLAGLIVVVSVAEEIIWRGTALGHEAHTLRTRWRHGLFCCVVYAGAHAASGSALLVLLSFGCGVFWAALRLKSGSLWPSMVAHVLWDLTILVFHPLV